jgi:hypothetical protein
VIGNDDEVHVPDTSFPPGRECSTVASLERRGMPKMEARNVEEI